MKISDEDFKEYQPLLFSLGYRMLGTVSETEDLIQEAFLRMYDVDESKIFNKKAYLCKIMTNLCLDYLKSARLKREQYIGDWNPEPLLINDDPYNPLSISIQKEGLSIAYLRLMENLSPYERATVVLRDFYEFSYREISNIINKNEATCRKIYSRSKEKLKGVEQESLSYNNNKAVVDRFVQAILSKDQANLLNLLSDQITLYSDGGGEVKAALRPIKSPPNVFAFLVSLTKKLPNNFSYEISKVNGQPAVIIFMDGGLQSIISFKIQGQIIDEIFITLNPKKLPKLTQ